MYASRHSTKGRETICKRRRSNPPAGARAPDRNHLLVFADRLIRGARRRRFKASRAELNRAYLELARLCIDRTLTTSAGRAAQ